MSERNTGDLADSTESAAEKHKDDPGPDTGDSRAKDLETSLERKVFISEALLRLFEKLGATFDLDRISRLLLMTISGQLSLGRAALYLGSIDGRAFSPIHSLGDGGRPEPSTLPRESGFARWVKRSQGPVFIDRYFTAGEEIPADEIEFLTTIERLGYSYACCVENSGDYLGILLLGSKVTGESFSSFDEEFLRMSVRVAAITIRNALLYHQSERFRERAEEFARVKKEYLVSNSRRLRAPLSVMKSSMWSIESDQPGNGILVDMARDAVISMESTLDQLLALSDIDIDDSGLELERTELASLVEDCLREYIAELEEKGLTVRIRDRSGGRQLFIDPTRIMVVLRNIMDNAIRCVDRGGQIVVETLLSLEGPGDNDGVELESWKREGPFFDREKDEDPDEEGRRLGSISREIQMDSGMDLPFAVISIRDDGAGIPASEIPTLSYPFKKIACNCDSGSSSGIGLTVAQSIIASHGGKLLCRSNEGEGSVFSIWLPISS